MKLVANIHDNVQFNVEQTQKKQKKTYATRKGKQTFEGLVTKLAMVKMKKQGKKKVLTLSWEGPYQFVGHVDGNGNVDFEKGNMLCIIRDGDGHWWERSRKDLQIYHVLHD
jgi:membrane-bound lytic murein transglycosylase